MGTKNTAPVPTPLGALGSANFFGSNAPTPNTTQTYTFPQPGQRDFGVYRNQPSPMPMGWYFSLFFFEIL